MAFRNSIAASSSARTCLCSPTTHPGSFRCSQHRSSGKLAGKSGPSIINRVWEPSTKTKMSKMSLLQAFLTHIIKPSSHDLQRRRNFQPKPSRFCIMSAKQQNQVAV